MARGQCQVEECSRPHEAKGLCRLHYQRLRLFGDPMASRPPAIRPSDVHARGRLTSRDLVRQSGATYRQIDYWTRRGYLESVRSGGGSGESNEYEADAVARAQGLLAVHLLNRSSEAKGLIGSTEPPWTVTIAGVDVVIQPTVMP